MPAHHHHPAAKFHQRGREAARNDSKTSEDSLITHQRPLVQQRAHCRFLGHVHGCHIFFHWRELKETSQDWSCIYKRNQPSTECGNRVVNELITTKNDKMCIKPNPVRRTDFPVVDAPVNRIGDEMYKFRNWLISHEREENRSEFGSNKTKKGDISWG